jgi:NTE family protein
MKRPARPASAAKTKQSAVHKHAPGKRRKTLALALGGGGARSLAQVVVIDALDELGIRPVAIAGTSFGALIGAACAAGMTGKEIRRSVLKLAHNRGAIYSRLMSARARGLAELLSAPIGNPLLIDSEKFCSHFLPVDIPRDFADLKIPLTVLATDLHGRKEVAFSFGALRPAVAASLAIPGLMSPVQIEGRVLVDGAAINPLPFDCIANCADVILAVDCSGGTVQDTGVLGPWDAMVATLQLMIDRIVADKLGGGSPDLLIRPNVGVFGMFDFFQASAIMRAAEPVKAEVKSKLSELLGL